jgi:4-amino-4-deoxy-L-arabinose transferase-like glycosyltransferase
LDELIIKQYSQQIAYYYGIVFSLVTVLLYVGNIYMGIRYTHNIVIAVYIMSSIIPLVGLKYFVKQEIDIQQYEYKKTNVIILLVGLTTICLVGYILIGFPVVGYDTNKFWAVIPQQIYFHNYIPSEVHSHIDAYNAYPNYFGIQVASLYFLLAGVNDVFMRLLSYLFFILAILSTYSIVCVLTRNTYLALSATVLAFSNLAVLLSATWMNHGQPILFYAIGSLLFLELYHKEKIKLFYITAGVFAGILGGIKYSAIPFLVALVAYEVIFQMQVLKQVKWSKDRFLELLYFLLPIVIISNMWIIRNILEYGNPLFPNFSVPVNKEVLEFLPSLPNNIGTISHYINGIKKHIIVVFKYSNLFLLASLVLFVLNNINTLFKNRLLFILLTGSLLTIPFTVNNSTFAIARYYSIYFLIGTLIAVHHLFLMLNRKSKLKKYLFQVTVILLMFYVMTMISGNNHSYFSNYNLALSFSCVIILFVYYKYFDKKLMRNLSVSVLILITSLQGFSYLYNKAFVPKNETGSALLYGTHKNGYLNSPPAIHEVVDLYYGVGTSRFIEYINEYLGKNDTILAFMDTPYYYNIAVIASDDNRLTNFYASSEHGQKIKELKVLGISYILDASTLYHYIERPNVRGLWNIGGLTELIRSDDLFEEHYNSDGYYLYKLK